MFWHKCLVPEAVSLHVETTMTTNRKTNSQQERHQISIQRQGPIKFSTKILGLTTHGAYHPEEQGAKTSKGRMDTTDELKSKPDELKPFITTTINLLFIARHACQRWHWSRMLYPPYTSWQWYVVALQISSKVDHPSKAAQEVAPLAW